MKEWITKALTDNAVPEDKAAAAQQIKALPRTEDGLFDLTEIDGNCYKAGMFVYPLYADFETNQNNKAGYMDIMAQVRILNRKADEEFTFENAAYTMQLLIGTITRMSPEIYENYRELVDMFREKMKKVIEAFHPEKPCACLNKEARGLLGEAVLAACGVDVLLAEKYEAIGRALLEGQG